MKRTSSEVWRRKHKKRPKLYGAFKKNKSTVLASATPPQLVCHICEKSKPPCDRGVYLAHGNGGAYSSAPAHKKCVDAFGDAVEGWNEDPGWYVRGAKPGLKDLPKMRLKLRTVKLHMLGVTDSGTTKTLVDFFRDEGAELGWEGDDKGWSPAETAIWAMKRLLRLEREQRAHTSRLRAVLADLQESLDAP